MNVFRLFDLNFALQRYYFISICANLTRIFLPIANKYRNIVLNGSEGLDEHCSNKVIKRFVLFVLWF